MGRDRRLWRPKLLSEVRSYEAVEKGELGFNDLALDYRSLMWNPSTATIPTYTRPSISPAISQGVLHAVEGSRLTAVELAEEPG